MKLASFTLVILISATASQGLAAKICSDLLTNQTVFSGKVRTIKLQPRESRTPSLEALGNRERTALMNEMRADAAPHELMRLAWAYNQSFLGPRLTQVEVDLVAKKFGVGWDINEQDAKGRTALMHAAVAGRGLLQFDLLRLGANPNVKDKDGRTAADLSMAVQFHAGLKTNLWYVEKYFTLDGRYVAEDMWAAFKTRDFKTLATLIANGAYVDTFDLGLGKSLLTYAAEKNDLEMMRFLIARVANVNFGNRDSSGYNQYPIMKAAASLHREAVELLVANGANIDGKGQYGYELNTVRQAIWNAASVTTNLQAEVAMLDWLLSKGANPDANLTPENLKYQKSFNDFLAETLTRADRREKARARAIIKILKTYGLK